MFRAICTSGPNVNPIKRYILEPCFIKHRSPPSSKHQLCSYLLEEPWYWASALLDTCRSNVMAHFERSSWPNNFLTHLALFFPPFVIACNFAHKKNSTICQNSNHWWNNNNLFFPSLLSSHFSVQRGVSIWNLLCSIIHSVALMSQLLLFFSAGTWPCLSMWLKRRPSGYTKKKKKWEKKTEDGHQRYQSQIRIETDVNNQLWRPPLKEFLLMEHVWGSQTCCSTNKSCTKKGRLAWLLLTPQLQFCANFHRD